MRLLHGGKDGNHHSEDRDNGFIRAAEFSPFYRDKFPKIRGYFPRILTGGQWAKRRSGPRWELLPGVPAAGKGCNITELRIAESSRFRYTICVDCYTICSTCSRRAYAIAWEQGDGAGPRSMD